MRQILGRARYLARASFSRTAGSCDATPDMMAVRVHATGGPSQLTLETVPVPRVAPGFVLVRNAFSGVNFHDVYTRTGLYPRPLPFVCGTEGAGEVVAVGAPLPPAPSGGRDDGVSDVFSVGDRVAYFAPGSYAKYTLVEARRVFGVPHGVGLDLACATLVQGLTAHYLTSSTFPLGPGHSCLVHAAAGGTGRLLCQLARQRGATVIATVGSHDKAAEARRFADHVLVLPPAPPSCGNESSDDKPQQRDSRHLQALEEVAYQVRALSVGGEGVDVCYDGVGRATYHLSVRSTRPRGLVCLFGNASGAPNDINPLSLAAAGSLYVTRPTLDTYLRSPCERAWRAGDLWRLIAANDLDVAVDAVMPLAAAGDAHRLLEARKTRGKLLLDCRTVQGKQRGDSQEGATAPSLSAPPPPPSSSSYFSSSSSSLSRSSPASLLASPAAAAEVEPFVLRHDDAFGVVTLTLNRPKAMNVLSDGMLAALAHELEGVRRDWPTAKVVVLEARGRAFCAGHDLREMHSEMQREALKGAGHASCGSKAVGSATESGAGDQSGERPPAAPSAAALFGRCSAVMQAIGALPQPVIAKVRGVATAAGSQLVAACDLAIAASGESSRFATSGITLGLFCSTPGVALGRSVASNKQALDLLLTGDFINGDRAMAMGLVSRCVSEASLDDETTKMARRMAAHSPTAMKLGKRVFYEQMVLPLAEAYEVAGAEMARNLTFSDAVTGIGGFVEKRGNSAKGTRPLCRRSSSSSRLAAGDGAT